MLGGKARFVTALPKNEMTKACITLLRGINIDISGIKAEALMGGYGSGHTIR